MGVHINLDVSALTMLFETLDTPTILHIKQAVLEETCRRTIHALVPEDLNDLIRRLIHDEVEKQVGCYDYKIHKVRLTDDVEKELKGLVKKLIHQEISYLVDSKTIKAEILQEVNTTLVKLQGGIRLEVASKINESISDYINHEVKARLNELLKSEPLRCNEKAAEDKHDRGCPEGWGHYLENPSSECLKCPFKHSCASETSVRV